MGQVGIERDINVVRAPLAVFVSLVLAEDQPPIDDLLGLMQVPVAAPTASGDHAIYNPLDPLFDDATVHCILLLDIAVEKIVGECDTVEDTFVDDFVSGHPDDAPGPFVVIGDNRRYRDQAAIDRMSIGIHSIIRANIGQRMCIDF